MVGPSSTAMAAAATPYVAWRMPPPREAEQSATQATAAASAYQAAFSMTVSPPVIAANRAQLALLTATNIFGQNTPAIAVNEAEYGEMWAQDATAMYGYAGEFGGRVDVDAVHRGTADHQPGRVGRAGGRGCPGHRHVDWRGRAVDAVAAALLGSHVVTEPRVARFVDIETFGTS